MSVAKDTVLPKRTTLNCVDWFIWRATKHQTVYMVMCFVFLMTLWSCTDHDDGKETCIPFVTAPVTDSAYFFRVEFPAGFTPVDPSTGKIEQFAPYPGNWGSFVRTSDSGTETTFEQVLMLGKPLSEGSTVEVNPVCFVQMQSAQGPERVFIVTPVDSALQTVPVTRFTELLTNYEPVRNIIQVWILNHKGPGSFQLVRWANEKEAKRLLE